MVVVHLVINLFLTRLAALVLGEAELGEEWGLELLLAHQELRAWVAGVVLLPAGASAELAELGDLV